jgi:hypothetical protein
VLIMPQRGGLVSQYVSAESSVSVAPTTDGSLKSLPLLEDLITDGIDESGDLNVTGALVANVLTVDAQATFKGAVSFGGHITVGEDTAGSVTVASGETSARVEFAQAYSGAPRVQVTPRDFAPSYRVTEVSSDGFTLELQVAADADVAFDWFAVGANVPEAAAPVGAPVEPVLPAEQTVQEPPTDESTTDVQPRSWIDRLFSFRG